MMTRLLLLKYTILSILLFLLNLSATASTIIYSVNAPRPTPSDNLELIVQDPLYMDASGSMEMPNYVVRRYAMPVVVYNRDELSDIAGNYWTYKITFDIYDGDDLLKTGEELEISFVDDNSIYEALNRYELSSDYARMEITGVEGIDVSGTLSDPTVLPAVIPEDIKIELRLEVERTDKTNPISQITHVEAASLHELEVFWNFAPGHESYELEYAYVDSEIDRSPTFDKIFEYATRVETWENSYKINLTFPSGLLFYRVRAVGRHIGSNTEGDYSHYRYTDWKQGSVVNIAGFEPDRHWQYTTSFAEEGKSKKVLTYFDDGLKNRQVQTNLSTEETTLVGTSHYDTEGRPTVSILPVPSIGNDNLFYKPNFNGGYNRNNFDKTTHADAMTTGAAYDYFSTVNSLDNGLYKEYIPDAGGYPLTQVQYRNDGTGRVIAQSGVGAQYQIGSGHETKYFYDDASEYQLRRLFGSNVGLAKYYSRNLVMDANGQLSVSYTDGAGRTIATALAGVSPENVIALDESTIEITEDLTSNNAIDIEAGCSTTYASIMNEVSPEQVVTFNYSMNGVNKEINVLGNEMYGVEDLSYCLSCNYELDIKAYDPCGAEVLLTDIGVSLPLSISGTDLCANSTFLGTDLEFTINMNQIGVYRVIKTLKAVDQTLDEVFNSLQSNGGIPDIDVFVEPANLTDCAITCEQYCVAQAIQFIIDGNPDYSQASIDFIKGHHAAEIQNYITTSCTPPATCTESGIETILGDIALNACDAIYNQMEEQVLPGGCLHSPILDGSGADILANTSHPDYETSLSNAIEAHPDYNHYEFCQELSDSRYFDYQLASFADWNELQFNTTVSSADFTWNGVQQLITADYNANFLNLTSTVSADYSNYIADMTTALATFGGTNQNIYDALHDPSLPGLSDLTTDEERFRAFIGFYLAAKKLILDQIKADAGILFDETSDCTAAPVEEDISDVDTQEEFDEYTADVILENCADYCSGQVSSWLSQLEAGCPEIVEGSVLYDNILSELNAYCSESCGLSNPLGMLLSDFSSSYLSAGSCGAEILEEIALNLSPDAENSISEYDQFYTCLEDEAGNPIEVSTISSCVYTAIEILDDYFAVNTNCSYPIDVVVDNAAGCFTGITLNADNTITFTGTTNSIFSHPWRMEYTATGGIAPLCDLDGLSVPQIASPDGIVSTASYNDGPDTETYSVQFSCVYPTGWDGALCSFVETEKVVYPTPQTEIVDLEEIFCDCMDDQIEDELLEAEIELEDAINNQMSSVYAQLNCIDTPMSETFTARYLSTEHHYTLYYYDQAGDLIQTVPPVGVEPLDDSAFNAGVWNGTTEPAHTQPTQYQFNTLGQVKWQHTPDGGVSRFKYDYIQRLRFSQDAEQEADNDFSYTKYDAIGRVTEVGEVAGSPFQLLTETFANNADYPAQGLGTKKDVTVTRYAESDNVAGFEQKNLRNRVASTYVTQGTDSESNADIVTYYSYDVHGNVEKLQHDVAMLDKFNMEYEYDLISGNVHKVSYQAGETDQFYHEYDYDADNRLTHVFTSQDDIIWEKDARYFYYLHGPMARSEVGNDKIQGCDHIYTLQGWIKGINSPGVNSETYEPGKDGDNTIDNINRYVARDASAYRLRYNDNDYSPITGGAVLGALTAAPTSPFVRTDGNGVRGLFNGNIVSMTTDLKTLATDPMNTMEYQYDALHRIRYAQSSDFNGSGFTANSKYNTEYTYDGNGNIDHLLRNGNGGVLHDLDYDYADPNGPNRLSSVSGQVSGSYDYDEVGNLTANLSDGLQGVDWTVYGKVRQVTRASGPDLLYLYDAGGNRLAKVRDDGNMDFYIRDASGNVMSVYEKTFGAQYEEYSQKEVHLYGSSRLGIRKYDDRSITIGAPVSDNFTTPVYLRSRGEKLFEFSNHLGNTLVTLTDQKLGTDANTDGMSDYYASVSVSTSDYYPFGLAIGARTVSSTAYRYGFNGKENDTEWGEQLIQDYGFRLYNPTIAKFLSVDPLAQSYPFLTPYQFASNTPVAAIDLDGKEGHLVIQYGANTVVNTVVEATFNYMFNPNVNSIGEAFKSVSYTTVFAESFFDLASSKKARMGMHATWNIAKYVNQVGFDNVTTQGLAGAGLVGVLQPLIGDQIAKHGWAAVAAGLRKLKIKPYTIRQIAEDAGVRVYSSIVPFRIPKAAGNDLAEFAWKKRKLGKGPNGLGGSPSGTYNIAVFKYWDEGAQDYVMKAFKSEASLNEGKKMKGHAEQRLLKWFDDQGIDRGSIVEVYSELSICNDCIKEVIEKLPNLSAVYFRFDRDIDWKTFEKYGKAAWNAVKNKP